MTLMHNMPLKFCLRWFSFTAYFALYLQLYYNNLSISKVINNCLEKCENPDSKHLEYILFVSVSGIIKVLNS